jgi:predicted  nucleic acid-binding Zn-ribbon protein
MTRNVKSAATRAQEQVDVLTRRVTKLKATKADLEKQAHNLAPEIDAVQKRLDYALQHPDLPSQTTTGTQAPTTASISTTPAES